MTMGKGALCGNPAEAQLTPEHGLRQATRHLLSGCAVVELQQSTEALAALAQKCKPVFKGE